MNEAKLFELDARAIDSIHAFPKKRFIYETLAASEGRPFALLLGPRGSGKSVLFRQLRSIVENSLYLSADTMESGDRLADIVKSMFDRHGITTFFIDEIHYFRDFDADLKELYDFLPVRIYCTSSVAASLESAARDLSRRVHPILMGQCSFREYLSLALGIELPPLTLKELFNGAIAREYLASAVHFSLYLRGAGYPFTFEPGAGLAQFEGIREKIRLSDIPAADPDLSMRDLDTIGKLMAFIGRSPIEGINYSSISQNLGITKYMAERFVALLERSFLLRRVLPAGTNVLREPKIFLELPYRLLYLDYEACIGALREDYFALCMEQHKMDFSYAKSTRGEKVPDFFLEIDGKRTVLEVGGKGKGRSQFKGLSYDRKVVLYHSEIELDSTPERIPLFLLGFAP